MFERMELKTHTSVCRGQVLQVSSSLLLGITITNNLTWSPIGFYRRAAESMLTGNITDTGQEGSRAGD